MLQDIMIVSRKIKDAQVAVKMITGPDDPVALQLDGQFSLPKFFPGMNGIRIATSIFRDVAGYSIYSRMFFIKPVKKCG